MIRAAPALSFKDIPVIIIRKVNLQNRRDLARRLSRIEAGLFDSSEPAVVAPGESIARAFKIGITGPLGAGKSSLIDQLIRIYRKRGLSVAIVAVDPSSPFSGGALLGDRVRMSEFAGDEGVFIRSLATRGQAGGLAAAAVDAADLFEQTGYNRVIIETVGVGQVEVDVAGAVDMTIVVLEPGLGDIIQTMKAGLMEIADLFVVNKKDLRGADRFIGDLEMMLEMKYGLLSGGKDPVEMLGNHSDLDAEPSKSAAALPQRVPGVLSTLARTGDGVVELCDHIEDWLQRAEMEGFLLQRRREQRLARIRSDAERLVVQSFWKNLPDGALEHLAAGTLPIREAARQLAMHARRS
ncbi:MAG: methylmalonyl Co-A mutase-associated GTPase MeaB [Calditrichaeota bacterium]|nr:methylmalonyl Co-A mutase-associated GTPase MeaB [Calditrichota bacterium]